MVEIYEDPRHAYLDRLGRELYQRLNAAVAPELIYDWLKAAIEKVAPADNAGAIMEWHPSFEIYDRRSLGASPCHNCLRMSASCSTGPGSHGTT